MRNFIQSLRMRCPVSVLLLDLDLDAFVHKFNRFGWDGCFLEHCKASGVPNILSSSEIGTLVCLLDGGPLSLLITHGSFCLQIVFDSVLLVFC